MPDSQPAWGRSRKIVLCSLLVLRVNTIQGKISDNFLSFWGLVTGYV